MKQKEWLLVRVFDSAEVLRRETSKSESQVTSVFDLGSPAEEATNAAMLRGLYSSMCVCVNVLPSNL